MFAGISAWQLGICLLLVILIFGTKRLRNLGEDVGAGIQGLRSGFGDGEDLVASARELAEAKKSLEDTKSRLSDILEGQSAGTESEKVSATSSGSDTSVSDSA